MNTNGHCGALCVIYWARHKASSILLQPNHSPTKLMFAVIGNNFMVQPPPPSASYARPTTSLYEDDGYAILMIMIDLNCYMESLQKNLLYCMSTYKSI